MSMEDLNRVCSEKINRFNKKLLIYVSKDDLKSTGGAAGYNYNLSMGLKQIGAENYSYMKSIKTMRNKIKAIKNSKLKKLLFIPLRILNYYRVLHKKSNFAKVDISKYDIVHFHNAKDLFEARDSLASFRGTVILTNHSPKPFSYEVYEDVITNFERIIFNKLYRNLIYIDEYAFNMADYIVFPCKQAEEPYYKKWDKYKIIHENNALKYRYLLTGTRKCIAGVSREECRKNYNIPYDAFVVSYVGRHNETKGYDKLKDLGTQMLNKEKNYFLIAGLEEPLQRIHHEHWIEIGWINSPHSIIASSDVFILPNKDTYFDLIMLEVLSLGIIIVASRTGGNKFFETIDAPGIFLYDTLDDAKDLLMRLQKMDQKEKEILCKKNKKLFVDLFSNKIFAKKYVDLINLLY